MADAGAELLVTAAERIMVADHRDDGIGLLVLCSKRWAADQDSRITWFLGT